MASVPRRYVPPPCARSKANFTCRGRDNHPQERRKEEKGVTLSMKKGGARKKDAENGRNSKKEIGKAKQREQRRLYLSRTRQSKLYLSWTRQSKAEGAKIIYLHKKTNFTCRGRDNHPQERRKEEKGVTLSTKKGGARKKDAENGRNSIKETGKGVRKRRNKKKAKQRLRSSSSCQGSGGPTLTKFILLEK